MKPPVLPAPMGQTSIVPAPSGDAAPLPWSARPAEGFRGFQTVRLGLCEDYPEESHPLSHAEADFRALRAAGVTLLRVSVPWLDIEPKRGRFYWAHLDGFFDLAERYGVTLIPYLCYVPRWASTHKGKECWKYPPKRMADWSRFVEAVVTRYRGRVATWEVWSEPDNQEFWGGTIEAFAELYKAGAAAIREADPSAKVVLGGIAWNTHWLMRLFRDHGVSPFTDIVNLHNYYETWIELPIEQMLAYVGRVTDLLARYGDNQPLWMAEVGYSTFRRGSYVSGQCEAYYAYEHTPRYQADHVVKTMALLLATGRVETVAWYEVRNLPLTNKVIGDVNNNFLGLCGSDLEELPGLRAFNLCNRLFAGPHRCIDAAVTVARLGRSDAHVHAFELADGRIVAVAWLQTFVPGQRSQRLWGEAADTRREAVELTLPGPFRGRAATHDATGQTLQTAAIEGVDGRASVRLLLRGGEVTVLELTPESGPIAANDAAGHAKPLRPVRVRRRARRFGDGAAPAC